MVNSKRYKYTEEEFLKIIFELVGDEYTVLSKYKGNRNHVLMRHNVCGKEWWITPHNFINQGARCPVENGKSKYSTNEYKEKLHIVNPSIILLDEYVNANTKVHFQCLKDKYIFFSDPKNVLHGTGCPVCAGRKILVGTNDLNTTNPEVSKYLENYEDGFSITYGSHKKLKYKCPFCSSIKKCRPNAVLDKNGKYKCSICGDGVSYPEKFISSIFEQLNINYVYQLTHKYFKWIGKFRYDFYIPEKNMIIEVNGMQHYLNNNGWTNAVNNDSEKYELAIKNNIKNYVYIDARYSEFDWLKENAIKSLSSYFDLSNINWKLCGENANRSLMLEVCNYITGKSDFDLQFLSNKFNLSEATIYNYIVEGQKIGLCSMEKYKHIINKNKRFKISNSVSNDIICLETGEIFKSITSVNYSYDGVKLAGIKNRPKQYGLTWEYYDKNKVYPKNYNFTLKEYFERYHLLTSQISKINRYDENYNYVETYNSLTDLSELGYSIGSISKYMKSRKKSIHHIGITLLIFHNRQNSILFKYLQLSWIIL